MLKRNTFCSFCGQAFEPDQPWPRVCAACGSVTYINPVPVAVTLIPCDGGLVAVRRGIEPRKGMLALPGGYINMGEAWQQAGAREVMEETGIRLDAAAITDFTVLSAPDGTVLIFGLAPKIPVEALAVFTPSDEATELVIHRGEEDLAFPLHTQAARKFFSR